MNNETQTDLTLNNLSQYYGTEQYHKISLFPNIKLTDGIMYIMQNGYSWFVTDALSVIVCKKEIREQEFLSIKLNVLPQIKQASLIITDGNENILYKQDYEYTDAKRDLNLFFTDSVLMLSGEY